MKTQKRNLDNRVRLLPQQKGLIFHSQKYSLDDNVYTVQLQFEINEFLDLATFINSLKILLKRYEILFSKIQFDKKNEPYFIFENADTLNVEIEDLQKYEGEDQKNILDQFLKNDVKTGFKLEETPLARFKIFILAPNKFFFVWSYHHALLGGDSVIVIQDLFSIYKSLIKKEPYRLRQITPYKDYIKAIFEGTEKNDTYWQETLKDFIGMNQLPIVCSPSEGKLEYAIPKNLFIRLKLFAEAYNLKISQIFHSVWLITTGIILQTTDVSFGCVRAHRRGQEHFNVGLFFDTYPIRVNCVDQSFLAITEIIKHQLQCIRTMKFLSHSDLRETCHMPGDSQLFNTILDYKNLAISDVLKTSEEEMDVKINFSLRHDYPILIEVIESPNKIYGYISFQKIFFSRIQILAVKELLFKIINKVIQNPNEDLQTLFLEFKNFSYFKDQSESKDKTAPNIENTITTPSLYEFKELIKKTIPLTTDLNDNDNFFEIGGHSLNAMKLIMKIQKNYGIHVNITSFYETPAIAELFYKIFDSSKKTISLSNSTYQVRHQVQDKIMHFPATTSQEWMWFLDQLIEKKCAYNVSSLFEFEGDFNPIIAERSLLKIIELHDAFRTRFYEKKGKVIQAIFPSPPPNKIKHVDLKSSNLADFSFEKASCAFTLETDFPYAIYLGQANGKGFFLLIAHHIIFDFWSLSIFQESFIHWYQYMLGIGPLPKDLPEIQPKDFYKIQNSINSKICAREFDFWKNKLKGFDYLNLHFEKHRPKIESFRGDWHTLKIPKHVISSFSRLMAQNQSTLYVGLITVYRILLYFYTNQNKIVIGAPIANRKKMGLEHSIGLFLNMAPLITELDISESFLESLSKNHKDFIESQKNLDIPIEEIIASVIQERDLSCNPLFQTILVLQHSPNNIKVSDHLMMKQNFVNTKTSKFDLSLYLNVYSNHVELMCEYNSDLFESYFINSFLESFSKVMQVILNHPQQSISTILLNSQLNRDNFILGPEKSYPLGINEMLQKSFNTHLEQTALMTNSGAYSYKNLAKRVNLAHSFLISQGVTSKDIIPVISQKSLETVITMLALFIIGATYVPLSSNTPPKMLAKILDDLQPRFIMADIQLQGDFSFIDLNTLLQEVDKTQSLALNSCQDSNFSYIIYTSGSTGTPKGVHVTLDALQNTINAVIDLGLFESNDRWLAITPINFDVSLAEILIPLCLGASILLVTGKKISDYEYLSQQIREHKISTLIASPSTWSGLLSSGLNDITHEFKAISTAEPLPVKLAGELVLKVKYLLNLYGPTEAGIWNTWHLVTTEDTKSASIPIGIPLANNGYTIVNSDLIPVPQGSIGELLLTGKSLSQGYWCNPEATRYSFFKTTLNETQHVYRTGDLVYTDENKVLHYIGRIDDQVKLLGRRIDLNGIDFILQSYPDLLDAVTLYDHSSKEIFSFLKINKINLSHDLLLDSWKEVWDQAYHPQEIQKERFIGWVSRINKKPFHKNVMEEWLEDITALILKLSPKKVLELGCGTGLLLFELISHVEKYTAVDISENAINFLHERICSEKVNLVCCPIAQFHPTTKFDTIIINSVIQYFPSLSYLESSLIQALSYLEDKGNLILGDVRSFEALDQLHSEICKFAFDKEEIDYETFSYLTKLSIAKESELVLSHNFFYQFAQKHNLHVEIYLKNMPSQNELSKYRFNVVLTKKPTQQTNSILKTFKWDEDVKTLVNLRALIQTNTNKNIVVMGIPKDSINADLIYRLGNRYGLQTSCLLTDPTIDKYTARFMASPERLFLHGNTDCFLQTHLSNEPTSVRFYVDLEKKIKRYLREYLPDYMVPKKYFFVDYFPLTSNTKINKNLLLRVKNTLFEAPGKHEFDHLNETEQKIALIYLDLLNVRNIDKTSSFFDLGGHSLLLIELASQLKRTFKIEVSLATLFLNDSVADLAAFIEKNRP